MLPRIVLAGHEFSTYWIIFLAGVAAMLLMNEIRRTTFQIRVSMSASLTLLVILFSLLGAKLLFYLETPGRLLEQGVKLDGVSFFGAVFLVPVSMWGVCHLMKQDYRTTMDFLSPSLMLMLAMLRVGCLFSGCCGGIACELGGIYIRQFPTQLTECICDLLIMTGLLLYDRYWDNAGRLYPFIMVYYGSVRFVLEFVRDTPKEWIGLSHGQWFALISVAVGGWRLYTMGKERKKGRYQRHYGRKKKHAPTH